MTRTDALSAAKTNHKAHRAAVIAELFKGGPKVDEAAYGYRHGWYTVGEFCFCEDEITGQPYDHTQGGWAFL